MNREQLNFYLSNLKHDIPSGIVVFLVALPLCLGIALASGAPLFAGLIAGIVGGLVVSWVSGSQLSVSGPAAGLTVIIFAAIEELGSFSGFLVSVVLAGVLQLIMGYLRAGMIGAFFPSSVIKGMLSAIGLILIIKQIPHAIGYQTTFDGDESYMMKTAESSFQELLTSFSFFSIGPTIVTLISLVIILFWETAWIKQTILAKLIPAQLIVVVWGIAFNLLAADFFPQFSIAAEYMVSIPITESVGQFFQLFTFPDFSYLMNPKVYTIAFTLAIIASLETLLSLEAVDKLDPLKRIAPTDRELKAQGIGNMISGLIGGLPITAVIVRSSANINAGGVTRVSSFVHGILLLISVMFISKHLNMIPLSCLAAILLHTGYKLVKPEMFINLYKQGHQQFLPFIATVVAISVTDLLQGIIVGIAVGLYFVVRSNYQRAITLHHSNNEYTLTMHKDVSFLNKPLLRRSLQQIEHNSYVFIDASKAKFIDHDIREILTDYLTTAPDDNVKVEMIGFTK